MRCIVTGASGFVGQALLPLLLADGLDVITLGRRPAGSAALWIPWDAFEAGGRPRLPAACCVLHLAGIAHQRGLPEHYRVVNVEATLALARAASAAGCRRFVYLSSINAAAASGAYGRSKREAEQGLEAFARKTTMQCIVLRPALVYGPRPRGNLALLSVLARAGIAPPRGAERRAMIALGDLAELLRHLVAAPLAPDRGTMPVWTVWDGERYALERIWRAFGRRAPGLRLPQWCWQAGFRVLDRLDGAPAGSSRQRILAGNCPAAGSGPPAAAGWAPRQTLESALGAP